MSYLEKMFGKIVEKLSNEEIWLAYGEGFLKILLVIIFSNIAIRVGKVAVEKVFIARHRSLLRMSERREATLIRLLDNILSYAIYFIAILMILEILTINVKGLLAGAGIVGLAVGFGAQSLVKDIITGFFIIFEDQFSVGDHIRIAQFEGTVEEIGLRTTKIKSWTGERHIVPNGSIIEITNFSIHNSVAFVDVSIASEGDIEKAEQVIKDLLTELPSNYEDIVAEPELLGVQNIGPSEVVLRVIAETKPMRHFYIARVLRREIKRSLDDHGIEIPFPRLVMYTRGDEEGTKKQIQRG